MFPVSQMLVVVRAKDLDTVFAQSRLKAELLQRDMPGITRETTPSRSLLPTEPTFPSISKIRSCVSSIENTSGKKFDVKSVVRKFAVLRQKETPENSET